MGDQPYPKEYTDVDFDAMSWHDCTIHGISLKNPLNSYCYDLVIDLDYILEWLITPGKSNEFLIAPALLTFSNVDKMHIDIRRCYKEAFEIDTIERQDISSTAQIQAGLKVCKWNILLHSLTSEKSRITFEATGFTQALLRHPVRSDRQHLDFENR